MEYRCLLWDFDGTLADTGSDVWNSLTYAARRAGGAIDDLYMRDDANLADPMDEIMRHVIPYPGEAYLETFDEDVRVHYRTLNDFSRTRLYPGIQSMLNELKGHSVRNIIVTNNPEGAVRRILGSKGWANLFDDWICPDSIPGREATKVEMIAEIVRRHGIAPRQCLYVGDTFSDIEAARTNGISCIAVTYGDGDEIALLSRNPAYVAHDIAELNDIMTDTVIHARSMI